jgi:hypothetical protein
VSRIMQSFADGSYFQHDSKHLVIREKLPPAW